MIHFLLLAGGQCVYLPSAIQTMNRTHVSAFKCTINSMLQKMLSAGIKGTSGTLNRRPVMFCWWAVMTSKPEITGSCFSCWLLNLVAKFGVRGSPNLTKGRTVIFIFTLRCTRLMWKKQNWCKWWKQIFLVGFTVDLSWTSVSIFNVKHPFDIWLYIINTNNTDNQLDATITV